MFNHAAIPVPPPPKRRPAVGGGLALQERGPTVSRAEPWPEPPPTEQDRERARAWLNRTLGASAPAEGAVIEGLALEFAAVRLEGAKAEARRLRAFTEEPKTTPHRSGDPLVRARSKGKL